MRYSDESPMLLVRATPISFGDICTNTVCRTHQLLPYRIAGEIAPAHSDIPNNISNILSQTIDSQILKV